MQPDVEPEISVTYGPSANRAMGILAPRSGGSQSISILRAMFRVLSHDL